MSASARVWWRREDIQGLRAVAVILVVIYHTGVAMPGGYVGVDVFFVISGYVITGALLREMGSTGTVSLRQFYLRRIRRILPALALMLVIVLSTSALLAPWGGQTITAQTGIAAALFSANIFLIRFGGTGYFDSAAELNALLHTWSLSVEEQFYMVFPALVIGAALLGVRSRRLEKRKAISLMLVSITGLSFALSWILTAGDFGQGRINRSLDEFAFFSSVTRAWEFAAGGLLVFISARMSQLGWRAGTVLSFGGLGLLAWATFVFDRATPFPGLAALIPVAGTMMLIAAGEAPERNLVTAILAKRPLQWFGDISYAWYLWHWPIIVFAVALWPTGSWVAVTAAALSIIPAYASYRFVENPIRFTQRPTRSTLRLASVCILSPLIAGSVLIVAHNALNNTETFREYDFATRRHADVLNNCDNPTPLGQRSQPACTWLVPTSIGRAVLIGDSNAGHFSEGFTIGMNNARYDATVATLAGCPFVDLVIVDNERPNPRAADKELQSAMCRNFVAQSLDDLLKIRPDFVVLASASDLYIEEDIYELRDPITGERARSAEAKQDMWVSGLQRTITALESAGIEVAVVHPIPKFPSWHPADCAALTWLLNGDACGATRPTELMESYRRAAVVAESMAIAGTNAASLDVFDELCESDPCTTAVAGSWLWQDGNHLSVLSSENLAPQFASLAPTS
jgi:peptidoglycan/LPS O-acetylase OafA/YrhL